MTKSSSTSRSLFILLMASLFAPSLAFASVKITDVMYDPAGADSGREWIQVTNSGPEAVDIKSYRLFEAGVNHKLSVVEGESLMPAGSKAIITTDPAQYKADHPSFAGPIVKSSFSLSNTGETIELKDSKLNVVDTYSYTAPPVVKAPKAAKTPKTALTTANTTYQGPHYVAGNQAAAAALSNTPLHTLPTVWLYGLGLITLLIVGAGAVLYVQPVIKVTSSPKEEFELE